MQTLKQMSLLIAASFLALVIGVIFVGNPARADCGFTGGNITNGDKIYHETCVACHGEDGRGAVPGAPNFLQKGGPLSKPHAVMMKHIMNGFSEPGHDLSMPPKGGNPDLSAQDLKDVHAYLHRQFGCGK